MKKIVGALCLAFATSLIGTDEPIPLNAPQTTLKVKVGEATKEGEEIKWLTSYNKALEQAKKENKPLMVDFYADWCHWCNELDETTYKDPRVIEQSKKFVNVKIDVEKKENAQLASRYDIEGLPTVVFINSKEKELERQVGYVEADEFLKVMEKALKKYGH